MKMLNKLRDSGRFWLPWWVWFSQGCLLLIIGIFFAMASVFKMDGSILSVSDFSWLPICGIVILILGILDSIDALFAKEVCDFMQRMNTGVLDIVFGILLVFGISDSPGRLTLLIALYLLVQGILRAIFSIVLHIPHLVLTVVACFFSIILGLMVWMEWPTTEGWFLSLSLNIEIAFRGLIMIFFAFFIKQQNDRFE